MSSNISLDIWSWSHSFPESIASIYSSLSSGGIIEFSSDLSPLYASLGVSDNKFPSSNCANGIIFPFCSFEDVAQVMYDTAERIPIAYAKVCDVYDNKLEKLLSKTTSYENIILFVLGTYTKYTFWC